MPTDGKPLDPWEINVFRQAVKDAKSGKAVPVTGAEDSLASRFAQRAQQLGIEGYHRTLTPDEVAEYQVRLGQNFAPDAPNPENARGGDQGYQQHFYDAYDQSYRKAYATTRGVNQLQSKIATQGAPQAQLARQQAQTPEQLQSHLPNTRRGQALPNRLAGSAVTAAGIMAQGGLQFAQEGGQAVGDLAFGTPTGGAPTLLTRRGITEDLPKAAAFVAGTVAPEAGVVGKAARAGFAAMGAYGLGKAARQIPSNPLEWPEFAASHPEVVADLGTNALMLGAPLLHLARERLIAKGDAARVESLNRTLQGTKEAFQEGKRKGVKGAVPSSVNPEQLLNDRAQRQGPQSVSAIPSATETTTARQLVPPTIPSQIPSQQISGLPQELLDQLSDATLQAMGVSRPIPKPIPASVGEDLGGTASLANVKRPVPSSLAASVEDWVPVTQTTRPDGVQVWIEQQPATKQYRVSKVGENGQTQTIPAKSLKDAQGLYKTLSSSVERPVSTPAAPSKVPTTPPEVAAPNAAPVKETGPRLSDGTDHTALSDTDLRTRMADTIKSSMETQSPKKIDAAMGDIVLLQEESARRAQAKVQAQPEPVFAPLPQPITAPPEPPVEAAPPVAPEPTPEAATPPLEAPAPVPELKAEPVSSPVEPAVIPPSLAGSVQSVPIGQIHVDPERFQFKIGAVGKGGVTQELKDVNRYDPELAGVLAVWHDPVDGRDYVVNGHHRLELAQRTGQKRVDVKYIRAANASEARVKGALINIAEKNGTATDAGKLFRDAGIGPEDLKSRGVSLRGPIARAGVALQNLPDELWRKVYTGELSEGRAALIGGSGLDEAGQRALYQMIQVEDAKGKPMTDSQIRETAVEVKNAPVHTYTQGGLFGDEEMTQNLAVEKGKLSAWVKQEMANEKSVYKNASSKKAADLLSKVNNVIDIENNLAAKKSTETAEDVYDQMRGFNGPVSTALNDAARQIAAGEPENEVKSRLYDRIRQIISETVRGGERPSSGGLEGNGGSGSDTGPGPILPGSTETASGASPASEPTGELPRTDAERSAAGQSDLWGEEPAAPAPEAPPVATSFNRYLAQDRADKIKEYGISDQEYNEYYPRRQSFQDYWNDLYRRAQSGEALPKEALDSVHTEDKPLFNKLFHDYPKSFPPDYINPESLEENRTANIGAGESPVSQKPGFGEENQVFGKDEAQARMERLRQRSTGLNANPFDPQSLEDLLFIGGYYLEGGVREFGAWSKALLDNLRQISPDLAAQTQDHLGDLYKMAVDRLRLTGVDTSWSQENASPSPTPGPGGVPPTPPVGGGWTPEVILRRFNLDPSGLERMRQAVGSAGLESRRIPLAEQQRNARLLADQLRLDPNDPDLRLNTKALGRLSGEEINARLMIIHENEQVISQSIDALKRDTAGPDAARWQEIIDRAEDQTRGLLRDVVTSTSQAGRDLGSLRIGLTGADSPERLFVRAQRILGDEPLTGEMRDQLTQLFEAIQEAC